jgi:hypothetical protein
MFEIGQITDVKVITYIIEMMNYWLCIKLSISSS